LVPVSKRSIGKDILNYENNMDSKDEIDYMNGEFLKK